MTIDRTPKPCRHPIADHQHGTLAKYKLDRCRCYPCALAANNHEIRRVRANAYGRPPMVPPDNALRHVTMLRAQGWASTHIAAEAGVGLDTISRLTGPRIQKRIARSVEERILAVQPGQGEKTDYVSAIGSSRRLQALGTLGWTSHALAARAGLSKDTILRIRQLQYDTMLSATRDKILAIYEQLWDVPAPASAANDRMRTRALNFGYGPPMAWDDDTIDDPAAEPDTDGPDPRMKLYEQGMSDRQIASVEGVGHDTIRLWRNKHQLPPYYRRPGVDARQALWDQGLTDQEIGERVSRNPDAIRRWRKRNGLESRAGRKAS